MAFIRKNLSPAGAQARAGVVPQEWTYTHPTDDLDDITGDGYFPQGLTTPDPKDNMLGLFRSNDWINVVSESTGAIGFAIIFIDNDGSDGQDITVHDLKIIAAV